MLTRYTIPKINSTFLEITPLINFVGLYKSLTLTSFSVIDPVVQRNF